MLWRRLRVVHLGRVAVVVAPGRMMRDRLFGLGFLAGVLVSIWVAGVVAILTDNWPPPEPWRTLVVLFSYAAVVTLVVGWAKERATRG